MIGRLVKRVDAGLYRLGRPVARYVPAPIRDAASHYPKATAGVAILGLGSVFGLFKLALGYTKGRPRPLLLLGVGGGQWASASTALAWYRMRSAAARDGVRLRVVSGWRSWIKQSFLYTAALARGLVTGTPGKTIPPTAPPGYSNHGDGTALDLDVGMSIADMDAGRTTPAYRWAEANAFRYGWKRLASEPWHFDHVG